MQKTLFWFRQDLRLHDNPGWVHACQCGQVLPIYIQDTTIKKQNLPASASDLWLHHSLKKLSECLNGYLHFYQGDPLNVLNDLVTQFEVSTVVWNRCYEPFAIDRDKKIKQILKDQGVKVLSFNSALLWEPHRVLKKDGTPYKIFTPYYRKGCLLQPEPENPLAKPEDIKFFSDKGSKSLDDLGLKKEHDWEIKLNDYLQVGEQAALNKLDHFINDGLLNYKEGRDFPDQNNVSRLSPHLHFGEISPRTVWHEIKALGSSNDHDHFLSELGWREFSYYILYHFPHIIDQNLQKKFDNFVWLNDDDFFTAWKKGRTGIP